MFSKKTSDLIPNDIKKLIFESLDSRDIYNLGLVNKAEWEQLLKDQTFWKKQYEIYFPHGLELAEKLETTTVQTANTCYWYQAFLKNCKRDAVKFSYNTSAFRLFTKVKQKKPLQEDEIKEMFESELPKIIKDFKSNKRDFYKIEDGSGGFYRNHPNFNEKIRHNFGKNYHSIGLWYKDPNRTFLEWAYINKHQQVLDEIFKQRAGFKKRTSKKPFDNIKLAITCNQIETLKRLLTNFALSYNKKSTLLAHLLPLGAGAVEILEILINRNVISIKDIKNLFPHISFWSLAVKYGNKDLVNFLLENKVPFESDTLMVANFYGHYSIANILIEKIKLLPDSPENNQFVQTTLYYAIHAAIALNDKQSLDQLLNAKAFKNLNFHPEGFRTCLGYATYYGNHNDNKILETLIKAGADPNNAGTSYLLFGLAETPSKSPIENAIMNCNYNALRLLLKQDGIKFADDIIKLIEPVNEHFFYGKKGPWYIKNKFYTREELSKTSGSVESLVKLMDYTKRIQKEESFWSIINIVFSRQNHFSKNFFVHTIHTDKILKKEISQTLLDCISGKKNISKLDSIEKDPTKCQALHGGRLGKIYKSLLPSIKEIQEANDDQNTRNNNTQQSLYALD